MSVSIRPCENQSKFAVLCSFEAVLNEAVIPSPHVDKLMSSGNKSILTNISSMISSNPAI